MVWVDGKHEVYKNKSMTSKFLIAGGSIPGRDHLVRNNLLIGRNNQDAFTWQELPNLKGLLAIVCDGCGSRPHSEVGSQLGAKLLTATITRRLAGLTTLPDLDERFWEAVRQDFLAQVRTLSMSLAGNHSLTEVISDYFLFTIVGALVTQERVWRFSIGDGLFIVNGEVIRLGPFPDNSPPYVSYSLVQSSFDKAPELLRFQVTELPADQLDSLVLGTDGLADLIQAEALLIPGNRQAVGPVSQFWKEERYFKNSDAIRRKLALINSQVTSLEPNGQLSVRQGLLPDDTTLVVIGRTLAN